MKSLFKNQMSEEVRINQQIKIFRYTALVLVSVGLGLAYHGCQVYSGNSIFSLADLGTYLAGSVGPVWALAGVAIIYIAFLGQQLQILRQQEDLKLAQEQAETQKKEMIEQNERLRHQQFEAHFFELMKFQNDIVNSMEYSRSSPDPINHTSTIVIPIKGKKCFMALWEALKQEYGRHLNPKVNSSDRMTDVYEKFYRMVQSDIGHYFRNLYKLTQFVDVSYMTDERKHEYVDLIRAQLSTYEQLLLWYNCHDIIGRKFKPLMVKYNLVKNVPKKKLLDPLHRDFYPDLKLEEEENEELSKGSES